MSLKKEISSYTSLNWDELLKAHTPATKAFAALRLALNRGEVRAAQPDPETTSGWKTNAWVKEGILLGFRLGKLVRVDSADPFSFFDKKTVPARIFTLEDSVRIVPGGTTVRDGAFIAPGVIIMPPAYVNIGAFIGGGTLIDSHALVGSCAQIGTHVHISAAAQIGGVLEPAGALPVIIEDDVLVGGNTGVYEGCIVKRRAVLGTGVVLTASTPIYDLVNSRIIRREDTDGPLIVPEGAVLVAGSRTVAARSDFAKENGLSLYAPIIIKYRDAKTDGRTALEEALR
jgi:2,3,4,5-tetrahydropyridine-2-carboxylate N-succinyltransferase